jgi:hypothetical protein
VLANDDSDYNWLADGEHLQVRKNEPGKWWDDLQEISSDDVFASLGLIMEYSRIGPSEFLIFLKPKK